MNIGWKEWNRNDVIHGFIIPLIVVLLIVGIATLDRFFEGEINLITCGTIQIGEQLAIVAIPLFLGLIWNRWAGGSAGFILGTLYGLHWADSYLLPFDTATGFGARIILLGYILSAILIGYMAGVLNRQSEDFRRMIITGIFSTTIGGILLFGIFHLSPINVTSGLEGFALTVITRLITGAIVPVAARFFFRYRNLQN